MTRRCILLCAALLLAAGCTDDNPVTLDGAPNPDGGQDLALDAPQPDAPLPDAPLPDQLQADQLQLDQLQPDTVSADALVLPDLGLVGQDYVFDTITLPTAATAATIGVDYDKDGTIDNALGAVLSAISGIAAGMDFQGVIDDSVNRGDLLQLLRIFATSLTTDPAALAASWGAQPKVCCTSTVPSTCASQAKTTCFSGSQTFSTQKGTGTFFSGAIASGKFSFGPTTMAFKLPLTPTTVVSLNLKAAYLKGTVSASGIASGVLAGAVSQSDLNTKVIPAIAVTLDTVVKDPLTDVTTKAMILTLFDTNSDGSISGTEIANNALIKTFLAGDVDVDSDGVNELSLGLSYTAVAAKIAP
jgi:hypothetical protein